MSLFDFFFGARVSQQALSQLLNHPVAQYRQQAEEPNRRKRSQPVSDVASSVEARARYAKFLTLDRLDERKYSKAPRGCIKEDGSFATYDKYVDFNPRNFLDKSDENDEGYGKLWDKIKEPAALAVERRYKASPHVWQEVLDKKSELLDNVVSGSVLYAFELGRLPPKPVPYYARSGPGSRRALPVQKLQRTVARVTDMNLGILEDAIVKTYPTELEQAKNQMKLDQIQSERNRIKNLKAPEVQRVIVLHYWRRLADLVNSPRLMTPLEVQQRAQLVPPKELLRMGPSISKVEKEGPNGSFSVTGIATSTPLAGEESLVLETLPEVRPALEYASTDKSLRSVSMLAVVVSSIALGILLGKKGK